MARALEAVDADDVDAVSSEESACRTDVHLWMIVMLFAFSFATKSFGLLPAVLDDLIPLPMIASRYSA
jgi:hypothetical protein